MKEDYIFTSSRLGFRSWSRQDLEEFAALNADPEVMEHFPRPLEKSETADFIKRLQDHYKNYGHCYFATEILDTGEFIGFIGLAFQQYESPFTPSVDIGWRLKKSAWGKGYATEGALRCLEYGFTQLNLNEVISTCPKENLRSERVMQKIGMSKIGEFNHPNLDDSPHLQNCVCYRVQKQEWLASKGPVEPSEK
ncbi:GNAT family N-acetyltransferase [Halocola ammonii]